MNTKAFLKLSSAIALAACFSTSVQATPITGSILLTGGITLLGSTPTLAGADGVSFGGVAFTDEANAATGSYASVPLSYGVNHADLMFDPFAPIAQLWSFTYASKFYSFDLTNLHVDFQGTNGIVLSGTGMLHIDGFDNTPGDWSFTALGKQGQFTFDSINEAQNVPEPIALSLLGIGLATLAAKRKSQLLSA